MNLYESFRNNLNESVRSVNNSIKMQKLLDSYNINSEFWDGSATGEDWCTIDVPKETNKEYINMMIEGNSVIIYDVGDNWKELFSGNYSDAAKFIKNNIELIKKYDVQDTEELKEAENTLSDDVKVYMNTWKNYNDYGADLEAYGIKDGWMTPEEALEFCNKYADDEPFINDTDNCPIEISEYNNPVDKLEELIRYDEYEDKELLKNAMETGQYSTVDDYIDVLESGDYIWFPGVDDNEGLARAYIDMVGGIEGITNKENYFDKEGWKDDVRADEEDYYREEVLDAGFEFNEDEFEKYLDVMADDMAENYDGSDESYFDYEAFGDELSYDYTFTSDGAINLF